MYMTTTKPKPRPPGHIECPNPECNRGVVLCKPDRHGEGSYWGECDECDGTGYVKDDEAADFYRQEEYLR